MYLWKQILDLKYGIAIRAALCQSGNRIYGTAVRTGHCHMMKLGFIWCVDNRFIHRIIGIPVIYDAG